MNEWSPIIAGFGFITVVLLAVVVFRHTEWARDLTRPRGLERSGPGGEALPRDLLWLAAGALMVGAALFAIALASHEVSTRFPNLSTISLIASVYFFVAFLLSGLALLYGLQMAGLGAWVAWKRRRHESGSPPAV